jgi:hypothetical protein
MGGESLASGPDEGREADSIEQIADPDNYNTRRRLRQLHDAKELVKQQKNTDLNKELQNPRKFNKQISRRNIAELLADYILELRPVLARLDREDEFLDEEVPNDDDDTIALNDIAYRPWYGEESTAPSIRTSMAAWDICNDYLEEIAGAMFESKGIPLDNGFDATDEGRGW